MAEEWVEEVLAVVEAGGEGAGNTCQPCAGGRMLAENSLAARSNGGLLSQSMRHTLALRPFAGVSALASFSPAS